MTPAATAPAVRQRSRSKTHTAATPLALQTRPRPTGPRAGLVSRAELVRRLVEASDATVVAIVAPPGYGKSTLIAEWAACDTRRFVWLALAEPKLDHLASADCVRTAVRALPAASRPVVAVIDDAHLLAPDAVRAIADHLLTELPEGSTLAVASRCEPPLALARLRANRALVEVRLGDLTMTPAEAAILLRHAGLELRFEAVQALVRRTEGWPAALYLAALSVREQPDEDGAATHLGGDDHLLAEYIRDEVVAGLSDDLVEFAIATSVLDELSGPVCDAVLGCRGSGLRLRELERTSELLLPLDPAHERYRWHGLLRDVLEAQLRRGDPDMAGALHIRASSWYQARGDADRAIDHAVRTRDPVLTGDLLWAGMFSYLTQGRNEAVQGWLAEFSSAELAVYPPLSLSAAYSHLAAGNVSEARHCAITAGAAVEQAGDESASLVAGLSGIEAMVAPAGVAGMRDAAARACSLQPQDSPWRPLYLFLHGAALHLSGDDAAGTRLLGEAANLCDATAPTVSSMCLAQAAMIAMEHQDWDTAADLTDHAVGMIGERGLDGYPMSALAFAAAAAVRAHDGRVDEAKQDLRRGIDLLTSLGDFIPWYGAEARILLAHASLWLADIVGARTLLAEASRLARRTQGAVIFQHWFDNAWSCMDAMAETSLAGPSSLTIAELRILRFLPTHRSFREIAAQLGVSANTVKTQAHAVYRKLGAASRSEAVARALDAGLLGQ